jgi:hypothetical protein
MEDNKQTQADSQSTNEPVKEVSADSSLADKRAAVYEKFKLQTAIPAAKEEAVADAVLKESESESTPVSADDSGSSSVKEDKAPVKTVSELENQKKALHEEREKRKEANRRLKELRAEYDQKFKDMEAKLEQAAKPKVDEIYSGVDDELRAENLRLRKEREQDLERRKQEDAVKNQQALSERISKATKELKEDGYPGFNLSLIRVDAAIAKRIEEGDILPEDAAKPETWKRVYIEDVYEEVASEFKETKKKDSLEQKLIAKQKAKLVGNPGSNPIKESSQEEEPNDMDTFNKKWMSERAAKNPNNRRLA